MHSVCSSEFFVNSFGSVASRELAAEGGMKGRMVRADIAKRYI
jgi:hypothetical protein